MPYPTGTITTDQRGRSRLWVRCPFCGDSQRRPWIAHAFIDRVEGSFYCYRCSSSEQIPDWTPDFSAQGRIPSAEAPRKPAETIIPGPRIARRSAMPRFHCGQNEVFFSSSGGYLEIAPDGRRTSHGPVRQGLGLGRWLSIPLRTTYDSPVVVVEGPWDVLDGFTDVCLFGAIPTHAQLDLLRGQFVVLRPDHDVLVPGSRLFPKFLAAWESSSSIVVGVDLIPGDPDDLANSYDLTHASLSSLRRQFDEYSLSAPPFSAPPGYRRGSPGLWENLAGQGPDSTDSE